MASDYAQTADELRRMADRIEGRVILAPPQTQDISVQEACGRLAAVDAEKLKLEVVLNRKSDGWTLSYELYNGKEWVYKPTLRELVDAAIAASGRAETAAVQDARKEADRVLAAEEL